MAGALARSGSKKEIKTAGVEKIGQKRESSGLPRSPARAPQGLGPPCYSFRFHGNGEGSRVFAYTFTSICLHNSTGSCIFMSLLAKMTFPFPVLNQPAVGTPSTHTGRPHALLPKRSFVACSALPGHSVFPPAGHTCVCTPTHGVVTLVEGTPGWRFLSGAKG